MGLWDLVEPKVHGMSLPRALNLLRAKQIPHPDAAGDGLGGVMQQPDQLPPPPPKRMPVDDDLDQCRAEARQQEAIDSYQINLRLRAKGIQNGQ